MRPGRPKQHVHNWVFEVGSSKRAIKLQPKSIYKPEAPREIWSGYYAKYNWKCIRGNKIKHIKPFSKFEDKDGYLFIAASGMMWKPEEIEIYA